MIQDKFLKKLVETRTGIDTLSQSIRSMAVREQVLQQYSPDVTAKVAEIQRVQRMIDQQYTDAQQGVKELMQILDTLLSQSQQSVAPSGSGPAVPSPDEVQAMMHAFFKGNIKKRSAPIPTYCGCYAWRNPGARYGDFVCAKIRNSYILMIVIQFTNNTCSVFDPTDVDDGVKIVELQKEEWTPLPTVIPEKPLKRWEHGKDSTVLSLWPNGDEWTTEFYKATVRQQPCERMDNEERGYSLDFGEDTKVIVPEKFVVAFPDIWRLQEG
jgi:hypothetical protein